jgi:hypothetical protein
MVEKKHATNSDFSALPAELSMRFALGDVPIFDPNGYHRGDLIPRKLDHKMESTVKRLIAHLKDEK